MGAHSVTLRAGGGRRVAGGGRRVEGGRRSPRSRCGFTSRRPSSARRPAARPWCTSLAACAARRGSAGATPKAMAPWSPPTRGSRPRGWRPLARSGRSAFRVVSASSKVHCEHGASWGVRSAPQPRASRARPLAPAASRMPGERTLTLEGGAAPGFISCVDGRSRTPKWVVERLTRDSTRGDGHRKNSQWEEEAGAPSHLRARLDDYRGSGYDRGHLAPAMNHKGSQKAMDSTFTLANCAPQVGAGFNRGAARRPRPARRPGCAPHRPR